MKQEHTWLDVRAQELPASLVQVRLLERDDRDWNAPELRLSRLSALKRLLSSNPHLSIYLIEKIGEHLPDLDLALVNRDLGWGPDAKLLAEVIFDTKEQVAAFNAIGSGPPLKQTYHVCCRVLRPGTLWQQRVGKGLEEGDFVLRFSEDGALKGFEFRRTPPISEKQKDGNRRIIEVSDIEGVDRIDLLNPHNAEARNLKVAGIAGEVLSLLLQLGLPLPAPRRGL